MKKLTILLFTVCSAVLVWAQPHSLLLYGTGSYDNNTYDIANNISNNSISFSINPGIGYQLDKHFTIGIQGGYTSLANSNGEDYYVFSQGTPANVQYNNYYYGLPKSSYAWSIGPFARYTRTLGNIFFVYGQLNVTYFASSSNYNYSYVFYNNLNEYSVNTSGFGAVLYPGIGINIYKGFALIFDFGGISYMNATTTNPGSDDLHMSHFNVNFAQQMNLGISKNFGMHHMNHKHAAEPGTELRKHRKAKDDDDDDDMPLPSKKQ